MEIGEKVIISNPCCKEKELFFGDIGIMDEICDWSYFPYKIKIKDEDIKIWEWRWRDDEIQKLIELFD